jgi:DNA polymerase-4
MDRFHGCYHGQTNSHNQSQRNRIALSFALSVNKTVSKIGTGESKPLEIPETMVKFLNRCPSKIHGW